MKVVSLQLFYFISDSLIFAAKIQELGSVFLTSSNLPLEVYLLESCTRIGLAVGRLWWHYKSTTYYHFTYFLSFVSYVGI